MFPLMIELKTLENKKLSEKRAGIDIICVIDDSGSMMGKKAMLVR